MPLTPANYDPGIYSRIRAAAERLGAQNWDVTNSLALVATSDMSDDSPSPRTTAPDAPASPKDE